MNNEKLNSEDLRKLAKYQIRLATMKGGNPVQEKVYKYKINDYTERLASRGVNTQSGGGYQEDLERQKEEALEVVRKIQERAHQTTTILPDQVNNLKKAALLARQSFDNIQKQYTEHIRTSAKAMNDLTQVATTAMKDLISAVSSVNIRGAQISEEDLKNITDNLTINNFLVELNISEITKLFGVAGADKTVATNGVLEIFLGFNKSPVDLVNAYTSELTIRTPDGVTLKDGITSDKYLFIIQFVKNVISDHTATKPLPEFKKTP